MILGKQSGLGRGLGALIPPKQTMNNSAVIPVSPTVSEGESSSFQTESLTVLEVQAPDSLSAVLDKTPTSAMSVDATKMIHDLLLEQVDPNPHQPRRHFDHMQLEDLITSIKEHGVLQPIVVTEKTHGRYELIAGERRLRASKIAGKETIPAIIRSATEQQKLELAIIENIQRQQLNALEEAESYLRLQNEFNLTQEQVAEKVGKSRPQVANTIRLMQLPEEVKQALVTGKITASNARTLLSLHGEEQMKLFQDMLDGHFTVRQAEARVPHRRGPRKARLFDPNVAAAETRLRGALAARVSISRDSRGEGEIRISFQTDEDFTQLVQKLSGDYGLDV
ncbi:ParB/RepB/Spo0J family partition protein [Candidatus Uhrbacteria bacterium]|nr:ParB/RepB/Spo0J family partition protein [Candidatus Uhrbacteria bacterium]